MNSAFLILYNFVRFKIKSFGCRNLKVKNIQLIGINSKLLFHRNSKVRIGKHCVSDGRFVVITDDNAILSLGDKVYFNEDCMISCKRSVEIGSGCKFGPNVKIFDNNHKFDKEYGVSNEHTYDEIKIGENCWIAANVVILKGTSIGKISVVGAGCVISGNIPEASIVTQNRKLEIERMR